MLPTVSCLWGIAMLEADRKLNMMRYRFDGMPLHALPF
jgi:hypothetical protein